MSFWRNQALEAAVGLATLPVVAAVGWLLFRTLHQFVDFTKNMATFSMVAIPFLISWTLVDRWLINLIKRRRETKGHNVS